jgi:uncharacterized protein YhbP (UPF0306 family)
MGKEYIMDIEKIIREYIPKIIHMSLATVKDNKPWVSEVHFAYDDDLNLYYRSLLSRRHSKEIANNHSVAGNIVKQHVIGEKAVGVYFEGTAKLLDPGDEQNTAFESIKAKLQTGDEIFEEAMRPDGHQFFKISVDTFYVFGAFNGNPSRKYELKWSDNTK